MIWKPKGLLRYDIAEKEAHSRRENFKGAVYTAVLGIAITVLVITLV